MCLLFAKIKETTEDIICYKVYISFKGKLRSLFMRSLAPNMNEITKTRLGEPYGSINCVDKGFHSFATLRGAISEREGLFGSEPKVIIKCIIPKGSKCYVGQFGGRTSYCSDSIKLINTVEL